MTIDALIYTRYKAETFTSTAPLQLSWGLVRSNTKVSHGQHKLGGLNAWLDISMRAQELCLQPSNSISAASCFTARVKMILPRKELVGVKTERAVVW